MLTATIHKQQVFKRIVRLMGNRFEISVVRSDEQEVDFFIDLAIKEIQRIEALLTTFKEESQVNQVNAAAGLLPVKVDREVFGLVRRSIRISELTQGAFDISYGSVDKRFWNFDTRMTSLPDPVAARDAVKLINYRNIILDDKECSVFLKEKGMRIGFGGIGKGYAAEQAKRLLKQNGIKSGIINAAGDLSAWGTQPDGKPWTIGIADPERKEFPFSFLDITNMAVATSGNYEKFITVGGKKYSHTIDPKTGYPVSGIKSVTIICPNAEIADAMATPVTIMGVEAGLNLINQIKDIACIIIDDNDRIFTSNNIKIC